MLMSPSAASPHFLEGETCRTSPTRDAVVTALAGVCVVARLNTHVFTCCLDYKEVQERDSSSRGIIQGGGTNCESAVMVA